MTAMLLDRSLRQPGPCCLCRCRKISNPVSCIMFSPCVHVCVLVSWHQGGKCPHSLCSLLGCDSDNSCTVENITQTILIQWICPRRGRRVIVGSHRSLMRRLPRRPLWMNKYRTSKQWSSEYMWLQKFELKLKFVMCLLLTVNVNES